MEFLKYMNERVKKFSVLDIKLTQGIGIFVALIIAKLIPQIMEINIWWFLVLLILCMIRPVYVLFVKK